MKKLSAVVLAVLLLLLTQSVAFAASAAEVYADEITAESGKTVIIPVNIKNNTGIMGFKITVSYDKSVLTSPTVTSGSLTENGMMNDSIGVTPEGTFDVIWSGTQNASGDGTLMILSFRANETDVEETRIKLSCSQPDTFNEAWEDVELKCSDITVRFVSAGDINDVVTEPEDKTSQTENTETTAKSEETESEEIKTAVDIVLDETGGGSVEEIPEEEQSEFVDRTNEILGQLTGGNNKPFESVEEIEEAYDGAVAEEFVEDTKQAVDSDKINASINSALDSVGVESIEQIPEEKKEEFVKKVESGIAQYAPDVDTISDKLTPDKAVEAIKQLQSENDEAATQGTKLPEPQGKNNTAMIIAVAAAILVAAAVIFTVVYKIRKKNKEAK